MEGGPGAFAQTSSCSAAAARKVSAAHRRTERPSAVHPAASLPIVVVLPAPFTPTTKTTHGRAEKAAGPAGLASARLISWTRTWRIAARPPEAISPLFSRSTPMASCDRGKAHVRGEQGLLHGLERRLVEGAPAADEVLDRGREDLPRAGEPAAEAIGEPH